MFHMRIHAFGATRINGQRHSLKLKKVWINDDHWKGHSKPTWFTAHHWHTWGVPAIPGRWLFVQIYVRLFCIDHNYRESNPRLFLGQKHRLCYQCDGCIRTHPRDDRNVSAKAPVGRWLGTELVTRETVDATIIWQAHTLAQQSCHISLLHSPWIWSWHQFWPWSLVAITLTVAMGSVNNSLHPCPSRTTMDWEFWEIDRDHSWWRHPRAIVLGWDAVDTSGWHHPSAEGRDEIHDGCDQKRRIQKVSHGQCWSDDPLGPWHPLIKWRTPYRVVKCIWTIRDGPRPIPETKLPRDILIKG